MSCKSPCQNQKDGCKCGIVSVIAVEIRRLFVARPISGFFGRNSGFLLEESGMSQNSLTPQRSSQCDVIEGIRVKIPSYDVQTPAPRDERLGVKIHSALAIHFFNSMIIYYMPLLFT